MGGRSNFTAEGFTCCIGPSTPSSCAACPTGKFAQVGQAACTDCPAGQFNTQIGQAGCPYSFTAAQLQLHQFTAAAGTSNLAVGEINGRLAAWQELTVLLPGPESPDDPAPVYTLTSPIEVTTGQTLTVRGLGATGAVLTGYDTTLLRVRGRGTSLSVHNVTISGWRHAVAGTTSAEKAPIDVRQLDLVNNAAASYGTDPRVHLSYCHCINNSGSAAFVNVQRALSVVMSHCQIKNSRAYSGALVVIFQVFQVVLSNLLVTDNTVGGVGGNIITIEDFLPLDGVEQCQDFYPTEEPYKSSFDGVPVAFKYCAHGVNITDSVFQYCYADSDMIGKWFNVVSIMGGAFSVLANGKGYYNRATAVVERCTFQDITHNAPAWALGMGLRLQLSSYINRLTMKRVKSTLFGLGTRDGSSHIRNSVFEDNSDFAWWSRATPAIVVFCNFTSNVNHGGKLFGSAPMGMVYAESSETSLYREFQVLRGGTFSDGKGGSLPLRLFVHGCRFTNNGGKTAGGFEVVVQSAFERYPQAFNIAHFRECIWVGNVAAWDDGGGALYVSGKVKVILEGCSLTNNSCTIDNGAAQSICGGAIAVRNGALLELRDTVLSGNIVAAQQGKGGSGIDCFSASVHMYASTVSDHTGVNAIRAKGCDVQVNGSAISRNAGRSVLKTNRMLPTMVEVRTNTWVPNVCGVTEIALGSGVTRFIISDNLNWTTRVLGVPSVQLYQQPANLDCAWTVFATTGAKVHVQGYPPYGSIDSKPGSEDLINIYAGTSSADPRLASWGGRYPLNSDGWSHTLDGGVLHVWFRTNAIPVLISEQRQKYSGFHILVDINISSGTAIRSLDGGSVKLQDSMLVNNDLSSANPATIRASTFTKSAVVPSTNVILPCSVVCHSTASCAEYVGGPSKRCWCPGFSTSNNVTSGGACGCPAGHGGSLCSPCGSGAFRATAQTSGASFDACQPCAQMHSVANTGATSCLRCLQGTFNREEGKSTCDDCAPKATPPTYSHDDTGGALCGTFCKAGYFWDNFKGRFGGECKLCSQFAVGADCTKPGLNLSSLPSLRGYWRRDESTTVFTKCSAKRLMSQSNSTLPISFHYDCRGGIVAEQCFNRIDSASVLCSRCKSGYKREMNIALGVPSCELCPVVNSTKSSVVATTVILLLIMVLGVARWLLSAEAWYVRARRNVGKSVLANKADAAMILAHAAKHMQRTWRQKRVLARWQRKHALANRQDAAALIQRNMIRLMGIKHVNRPGTTGFSKAAAPVAETVIDSLDMIENIDGLGDATGDVTSSSASLSSSSDALVQSLQHFDWHHMQVVIKILVSWLQCVGSFDRTFTIPWPATFSSWVESIQAIFSDGFNVLVWIEGLECSFDTYFESQLTLVLVQLPIAMAVLAVAYVIAFLRARILGERRRRFAMPTLRFRLYRALSFIIFFVYPSICTKCFLAFKTTEVDGVFYLFEDMNMRVSCSAAKASLCDEVQGAGGKIDRGYRNTQVLAIAGTVIFVFGIPLFYLFNMYIHRAAIIHNPDSRVMMAKFGPLYADFKGECWYFEIIDMFRKMLMTGN
jgi:hypothetical protein